MQSPTFLRLPVSAARSILLLLLGAALLPLHASPSNKWRLEASGTAKVAGEVELSFTPKGGAHSTVVVQIPARTGENQAARLIRDAIIAHYGKSVYHAEVDDGEDVLVKAKRGTPSFDLIVTRNTAEGLRLNLDKE